MVGQLAAETGWSVGYILDRVNVVTLQLMTADMPHWVPAQRPDPMRQIREMERREKERDSHAQTRQTREKGVSPLDYFTNYAVKD